MLYCGFFLNLAYSVLKKSYCSLFILLLGAQYLTLPSLLYYCEFKDGLRSFEFENVLKERTKIF